MIIYGIKKRCMRSRAAAKVYIIQVIRHTHWMVFIKYMGFKKWMPFIPTTPPHSFAWDFHWVRTGPVHKIFCRF